MVLVIFYCVVAIFYWSSMTTSWTAVQFFILSIAITRCMLQFFVYLVVISSYIVIYLLSLVHLFYPSNSRIHFNIFLRPLFILSLYSFVALTRLRAVNCNLILSFRYNIYALSSISIMSICFSQCMS